MSLPLTLRSVGEADGLNLCPHGCECVTMLYLDLSGMGGVWSYNTGAHALRPLAKKVKKRVTFVKW